MNKSGIYLITNTVNGTVYVGSAVNIKRRFEEHRKHLRGERHKNRFLQNAWAKHGEQAFVFSVLFLCSVESLIQEEQKAIDHYAADGRIYNLSPVAGSRLGAKVSEQGRKNISAAQRGQPGRHCTPHTEETKAKLRARVVSDETRAKMAAAKLGKKRPAFTEETRRRMSEAQKGRVVPAHVLKKFSEERKGVPWSPARRAAHEQRLQRMNHG
jgi:group I intron endonuclease